MTETTENKFNDKEHKIKIIFYTTSLSICIFLILFRPVFVGVNLFFAESAYNHKNYVSAYKSYKNAFMFPVDNDKAIEHYVDTLSRMKKNTSVQKELIDLYDQNPDKPVTLEIEGILGSAKQKILSTAGDNYIDSTLSGNQIIHWNNLHGALKVYIDNSNSEIPQYYIVETTNALKEYSNALNNRIRFDYVKNKQNADITVRFVNDISGGSCTARNNCQKVLGLTTNDIRAGMLKQSHIDLRTKDLDGSNFTKNQIYNIAIHELGHALGIAGHSYYTADVMYPINNDADWEVQTNSLVISRQKLTSRDINTLILLYKTIPDATNYPYTSKNKQDMYYPALVVGLPNEIGEKKLAEAQQYASTVSGSFISKMTLAEGYFANKNYTNAKNQFFDALTYASTDEEKFTVYNNLAVVAYSMGNYKEAIGYAGMANNYSKDALANEIKSYCYIELKDYQTAQKLLETLTSTHPDNLTYSSLLTTIYFKQFKFLAGIHELKRIKQTNPLSIRDSEFSQYHFLMQFI